MFQEVKMLVNADGLNKLYEVIISSSCQFCGGRTTHRYSKKQNKTMHLLQNIKRRLYILTAADILQQLELH